MSDELEIDLGRIPVSALDNPAIRHALTLYVLARTTDDSTDPENFSRIPRVLVPLYDALLAKPELEAVARGVLLMEARKVR